MIERLKSFLRETRIKHQILMAMIVVSLVSTIIMGNIIYQISKQTIEKNYQETNIYNLQVSSNIIDIQLKSIVDLCRTLLVNDPFKRYLTSEKNKVGNIGFSTAQNHTALEKMLRDLTAQDVLIEGISVVNENGNCLFATNQKSRDSRYYKYYKNNDILKEPWVEEARQAKGKEVFFSRNVLLPDDGYDGICYVKNLINPSTNESMGFLIVMIKGMVFQKAFGKNEGEFRTNRYMVLDERKDNTSAFFNGDQADEKEILTDYQKHNKNSKYLYSSYQNEITGWNAVNVIEKEELSHESELIRSVTLFLGIGLILFSFYISNIISIRISKPLSVLEKTIESVGEGSRHITEIFDNSEIGDIGNKFKEMVNNNLELRERLLNAQLNQREAELLLLQSQINPHFLYNTLDSLYCMAVIKEDDDIAKMVLALSNTFKLSLNKGDKFTIVEKEIQRMKEYMLIQNMRYQNKYELILKIEKEIESKKIISFILQPFIENAMYHGLEPKIEKGYIKVSGKQVGDELRFEIEDDGVGMDDISLTESGYGIKNVKERIRLYYGEEYGVNIQSKKQEGTKVSIQIPVVSKEG